MFLEVYNNHSHVTNQPTGELLGSSQSYILRVMSTGCDKIHHFICEIPLVLENMYYTKTNNVKKNGVLQHVNHKDYVNDDLVLVLDVPPSDQCGEA